MLNNSISKVFTPPHYLTNALLDFAGDYCFILKQNDTGNFILTYLNENTATDFEVDFFHGDSISFFQVFPKEGANQFLEKAYPLLNNGHQSNKFECFFDIQGDSVNVLFNLIKIDNSPDSILVIGNKITPCSNGELLPRINDFELLKTSLLSNLHHEIRTPIYGILGFSSILKDELVDTEQKEMLQNIYSSGMRLMSTLQALLDFSQLESQSVVFENKPINLSETLSELCLKYQYLANEKKLSFIIPDLESNIFIMGEKQLVSNAIANVIDNAIKFTETGFVQIEVKPNSKTTDVIISDSGKGIPKEFQNIIFEEFRQVSEGMGRSSEGIGLGLTITRKILQKLGGSITVMSHQGNGSVFIITLLNSHLQPVSKSQDIVSAKKQILVVEDNAINSELTSLYLKPYSYNDFASNGLEAVELATSKHYDLILMDIDLGFGMNGIETMNLIKEKTINKNTPFIALTGYASIGAEDNFLQTGFNGYIPKPFSKDILLKQVNSYFINQ